MADTRVLWFYASLLLTAMPGLYVQSQWSEAEPLGWLGISYLVNYLLAAVIVTFLFRWRKRHIEKLGFLFLAGTGLKFLTFFFVFFPVFHADGILTRSEFVLFFVPYALSTLVETVFLVRVLNRE